MSSPTDPIDDRGIYAVLAEMAAQGRQGVLVTVVRTRLSTPRHEGSKMIIHQDGTVTGSIGGGRSEAFVVQEATQVMADQQCRFLDLDLAQGLGVCGGRMEVFLEPVLRSAPFVVIGAGHVGRALLEMGSHLSFHFTLVDDRPEFLSPWQTRPGVRTVVASPADLGAEMQVFPGAGLLLASRNHELDSEYLEAVLRAEMAAGQQFRFLGVLGSRSKANRIAARIRELGPEFAQRMESVQMPVGLDVAAETPAEIALSIFAEALAVLRAVEPLKNAAGQALGFPLHRQRK